MLSIHYSNPHPAAPYCSSPNPERVINKAFPYNRDKIIVWPNNMGIYFSLLKNFFMKRISVSLMALLLIGGIIGLSAFKQNSPSKTSKKLAPLYWYQVNLGSGGKTLFTNSDVVLLSSPNTPTESYGEQICEFDEEDFKCVIGIDPSHVNGSTGALIDGAGMSPVPVADVEQYRISDE